jgi:hypothetical protein
MLAGVLSSLIPDAFWSCLLAYLALALVMFIIFTTLKRRLAEKLVNSDLFKGGEYYLGMAAGLARLACVLLFALALLNARVYTPAEIAQAVAADQKNFGGGAGSGVQGNYFPHLFQVQSIVFKESFFGPLIKKNLGRLLINTGQPGAGAAQPGTNAPEPPKKKPVIKIGY